MTSHLSTDNSAALTSLRGLAALMVVFYHFSGSFLPAINPAAATGIVSKAYLWVDFFFVLSGFIMAHAYGAMFAKHLSAESFKKFVIARLARIYPLHLFVLSAFVVLEFAKLLANFLDPENALFRPFEGNFQLPGLVLNVLLLQTSGLQTYQSWNGPAWSIGAEFFAYLLFPVIAAFMLRGRSLNLLASVCVCVTIVVALVTWNGTLNITNGLALLRCAAGFLLGIAAYRVQELLPLCPRKAAHLAVVLTIGLLVAMHFRISDLWFPMTFSVLVATIFRSDPQSLRVLRIRPLINLGEISYSIYLTHYFVLKFTGFLAKLTLGSPLGENLTKAQSVTAITIMMGAVVTISFFTYRNVEAPSRLWLKQRFA